MPNHFTWLSAPGLAALSVLHLRGEGAFSFLLSRGWRESEKPRHVWLKNARGEALDEVMVAREDGGFTVTCHGGPAVRAAFEVELRESGFAELEPVELPLFGAATRYKREMLRLLTQAQSDKGVRYCLWALEHGEAALARELDEAWRWDRDYDYANRAGAAFKLRDVTARSVPMERFFDPYRVHLWGPVNAGKSSLLNALCGEQLAAVGEEPGLTRDVIEGRFEHKGFTIRVFDAPGEISGGTELEQRAFREAREQNFTRGDVVLHLVPPGRDPPSEKSGFVVFSRADESHSREVPVFGFPCAVSVRRPESIARLKDYLVFLQSPGVSPEEGNAFALSSELRDDLWSLTDLEVSPDELRRKWL